MFRIIFSERRHGTTYLCHILGKRPDSISLYEPFNKRGVFYCKNKIKNYQFNFADFIQLKLNEAKLNQFNSIYFKILINHRRYFMELLKNDWVDGIIFLRRDYKDSYSSLVRALTEGDWSFDPSNRIENELKGVIGYTHPESIPSLDEYKISLDRWFKRGYRLAKKHQIPHVELKFEELTAPAFDPENLISRLFYEKE